ncbi:hypothetical protein GCM10023080_008060 [Streptomyces pseudoechinosporeus]
MHHLQPQVLRAVVGRDRECASLFDFLADPSPAMRLGVVSGRRRHGKSYLLRALCESVGGLRITAISQEGRFTALRRFREATAAYAGLEASTLNLPDWREVLTTALEVTARHSLSSEHVAEVKVVARQASHIPWLWRLLCP